jgi:hypothetical protein
MEKVLDVSDQGVVATPPAPKKLKKTGAYAGKSKGSEGYREADAEQTR